MPALEQISVVFRGPQPSTRESFAKIVSSAILKPLHHYIIPSLLKEKPDTVFIHVGSDNMTHRIFEDFNTGKLADEMINNGKDE